MLVDLAGSERASQTGNTAQRLNEGKNINKSLLALGNCINALVDSSESTEAVFVPYRDSKLTRIMKDFLNGNSKILMIANVTPAFKAVDETMNTLAFANKAKNIKVNVRKNVEVKQDLSKYEQKIDMLNEEISDLRHQLASQAHQTRLVGPDEETLESNDYLTKIDKANKQIAAHFFTEISIKREVLDGERQLDTLELSIKEKEYELFKHEGDKSKSVYCKDLKKQILQITANMDKLKEKINEKMIDLNQEKGKRDHMLALSKQFSGNIIGNSINLNYQYHVTYLKNMEQDFAKIKSLGKMRRTDIKIAKLVEQIKLRDHDIERGNAILKHKAINPKEEGIVPFDELGIEGVIQLSRPLIARPAPLNKISNLRTNLRNEKIKVDQESKVNYSAYNHPYIVKKKPYIHTRTGEIIKGLKTNTLSTARLNMLNDLYPNSKILYKNKEDASVHGTKENVVVFDKKQKTNRRSKSNSPNTSRSLGNSILERSFDQKTKTILRKNIVGRYRKSPYFRNINT